MKYVKINDGQWVEPHPQEGHKISCCDCGLVHIMNFRVVNGNVQFQAYRDERATGQKRRKLKKMLADLVLVVVVGFILVTLIVIEQSAK